MNDEGRKGILERLARGEIDAATASRLLDELEAGAAASAFAGEDEPGWFKETTQWSPAGVVSKLVLENFAGNVAVRAGTPAAVVATVRVKAADEAEARKWFDKVELSLQDKDDKVKVKADFHKSLGDLFAGDRARVDFDVTVPAAAGFELSLGAGNLKARGVASVNANVGAGDVDTDAADFLAKIGNGKATVARPRYVDVDMGNGALTIDDGAEMAVLKYNAGNGALAVAAERLFATADYKVSLGNGKVAFDFGRKPVSCLFVVESLAGGLTTDVPFNKDGSKMTYADGEPKANVKISAGHSKITVTVKEK